MPVSTGEAIKPLLSEIHNAMDTINGQNVTSNDTSVESVERLLASLIGAQHEGADVTREALADREAEARKAAAALQSKCRKLARAAAGLDPSSKLTPSEAKRELRMLLERITAPAAQ